MTYKRQATTSHYSKGSKQKHSKSGEEHSDTERSFSEGKDIYY